MLELEPVWHSQHVPEHCAVPQLPDWLQTSSVPVRHVRLTCRHCPPVSTRTVQLPFVHWPPAVEEVDRAEDLGDEAEERTEERAEDPGTDRADDALQYGGSVQQVSESYWVPGQLVPLSMPPTLRQVDLKTQTVGAAQVVPLRGVGGVPGTQALEAAREETNREETEPAEDRAEDPGAELLPVTHSQHAPLQASVPHVPAPPHWSVVPVRQVTVTARQRSEVSMRTVQLPPTGQERNPRDDWEEPCAELPPGVDEGAELLGAEDSELPPGADGPGWLELGEPGAEPPAPPPPPVVVDPVGVPPPVNVAPVFWAPSVVPRLREPVGPPAPVASPPLAMPPWKVLPRGGVPAGATMGGFGRPAATAAFAAGKHAALHAAAVAYHVCVPWTRVPHALRSLMS